MLGRLKKFVLREQAEGILHAVLRYPSNLPIDIIIPFYKQPSLVKGLFESLQRVGEEVVAAGCQVIAINDSPDDGELKPLLRKAVEDLASVAPCRLVENSQNVGFGRSINGAAAESVVQVYLIVANTLTHSHTFVKRRRQFLSKKH